MSKRPSIVKQIIDAIKEMDYRGYSRHQAKKEYRQKLEEEGRRVASNRVPGKIFSDKTFENYMDRNINFGKWARDNIKVRWLSEIKENHLEIVNKYIDFLELEQGISFYTIHGYVSAITMLLHTNNSDYDLPEKNYKNIKKNRKDPDAPIEGFNHDKHKELIRFIKATGLRNIELRKLRPEQIIKDNWGRVFIKIMANQAKGGRPRIVFPILSDADWVYEYAKFKQNKGEDRVFSKKAGELPKRTPYHPCRAVFAERKYMEAEKSHGTGEIYTRRGDGRKFDKGALQIVSENLGHNRLGICIQNYLWRDSFLTSI